MDAKGKLLTHGYRGYSAVLAKRPGITQACCWSHCRRSFEKALKAGGVLARDILLNIQSLLKIN